MKYWNVRVQDDLHEMLKDLQTLLAREIGLPPPLSKTVVLRHLVANRWRELKSPRGTVRRKKR